MKDELQEATSNISQPDPGSVDLPPAKNSQTKSVTPGVDPLEEESTRALQVSEEKVGHALKRLGLFTRRLGNKGRGLELTKETQLLVHELARLHQGEAVFRAHTGCAYCQNLSAATK